MSQTRDTASMVKLNHKMTDCMNLSPGTILLHIAKVSKKQNAGENQSDLAVDAASFNHVLETD